MTFRIGTQSTFDRFLLGLRDTRYRSSIAQEQISSGLRILRPSDDPVGAARSLGLSRRLSAIEGFGESAAGGRDQLDAAASSLLDTSNQLSDARATLIEALNGTLAPEDRRTLAEEFGILRSQLLDAGNQRLGERYLFGGTRTATPPWEELRSGGTTRVVYRGNDQEQRVRAGDQLEVAINLAGEAVFGGGRPSGVSLSGTTGLASGATADQGSGFETLTLRHDATDAGALASVGIQLVDGGAQDTLLGDHALVIDAAAGTIRLGDGPARALPAADSDQLADFVVESAEGAELHLDLSGYGGADYSGTVRGQGSISIDGTSFVPLAFDETDLELESASGSVVHVDTTGVRKAGSELATFTGSVNVFDLLGGIADDLRSGQDPAELFPRLRARLDELDLAHERLVSAASTLGARSQRLAASGERAADLGVELEGLLSRTRDVDIAAVALELSKTDATLQIAQSVGARLLQTTFLNFLG